MPALLQLVVDNGTRSSNSESAVRNQSQQKLAKQLLERASLLLNELGAGYSSVSSIIDECSEMIGRKDCEPFANLVSDKCLENLP